jgi:hypothetical protein
MENPYIEIKYHSSYDKVKYWNKLYVPDKWRSKEIATVLGYPIFDKKGKLIFFLKKLVDKSSYEYDLIESKESLKEKPLFIIVKTSVRNLVSKKYGGNGLLNDKEIITLEKNFAEEIKSVKSARSNIVKISKIKMIPDDICILICEYLPNYGSVNNKKLDTYLVSNC